MYPIVENLTLYIQSIADSGRSGDYGVIVGEKRSFADFVSTELDDSDQPKAFVNELVYEVESYQKILRRTKEFQC